MCGINGYFQFTDHYNNDQISQLILRMNDEIKHRGPDDDGIYVKENIGLGMRRLSIIDLYNGKQPIYNETNTLVIVFNGEIYNYKSLKKDLILKGHNFTTSTDTEVILHCYEEYGTNGFNKLKGMFAFAIYDIYNKKLFIVRDRTGEKPLYFYCDSNYFLFASELKSMISTKLFTKQINKEALSQYLQLTYIPAPNTIFENVYKLEAGHYIEVNHDNEIKIEQYWDIEYKETNLITDYEQCKKMLRKTLFHAVEECMVSDAPIGAFLSGGIDSSIIVGIMSQISNKPINTFTIGFKEKQYNESNRAELTAAYHKTNHNVFYLDYNSVLPEIDTIINNIDEPFADSSYIPTYMVSKYSKQFVKTVLTGDAGDELFGGYNKYLIGYYTDKYNKIPQFIRDKVLSQVIYSLPDNTSFTRKMRKVIENSENDNDTQRKNLMCLGFKNKEMPCILSNNQLDTDTFGFIKGFYKKNEEMDEITRTLFTDYKVVLEGDMLTKVDRASMLSSLETRIPMLHKDVVDLSLRIPSKFKINAKNTKIILKDTFEDMIPDQLMNAKKSGFGVPIGNWFQNELKGDLLNLLEKDKIEEQNIFNYNYIDQILNEHLTLSKNRSSELWSLYVFEKWYMNYFE